MRTRLASLAGAVLLLGTVYEATVEHMGKKSEVAVNADGKSIKP
jgi:hypothetical protein